MKLSKKKIFQLLFLFIIIFVSTRGAFVFFFEFPSNILYPLTTLLVLFFGTYASIKVYYENFNYGVNTLKKLIYFNILLLSIFLLVKIIFPNITYTTSGKLMTSDITTFLIFPIALLIVKWSPKLIIISLFCILITQMIGIFIFKYYSIVDYTILYEFETKVIPNYISVSHINNQFSIGGFIGSHHDVANLLTILLLFFISYFKISNNTTNKFFILPIIFSGTIALFFTNSASNIAVFVLFLFIMFVFIIKRSNNLIYLIKYLSFGILALLIFNWFNLNYLKIDSFLLKFEPLYEGFVKNSFNEVAIFNALDFDTIIKSSLFLLTGFADHFNLPINITEIGFLRLWLKLGLIPFIILSFILFSPIFLISRANKSLKYYKKKYPNEFLNNKLKINYLYDRLFLYSMPVLGGTMTLLHYGSLFRSTSIGVWCLVLAYFLKQYINFIKIISIK